MLATCSKWTKNGTKSITGKVLQRGMGTITLVVTDKSGQQQIKRFDETAYTVRIHD